jgi:hypothetical protein
MIDRKAPGKLLSGAFYLYFLLMLNIEHRIKYNNRIQ